MVEHLYEGEYTKVFVSDNANEYEVVDNLASEGWILATIFEDNGKYFYWFQAKRKVYTNIKIQSALHHI